MSAALRLFFCPCVAFFTRLARRLNPLPATALDPIPYAPDEDFVVALKAEALAEQNREACRRHGWCEASRRETPLHAIKGGKA